MKRSSDALRRGIRTGIDAGIVVAILQALVAFGVDITEDQWKAIVVLATAVLTWLKNAAEDAGAVPALLKATASSGANPVPDPRPNRPLRAEER